MKNPLTFSIVDPEMNKSFMEQKVKVQRRVTS